LQCSPNTIDQTIKFPLRCTTTNYVRKLMAPVCGSYLVTINLDKKHALLFKNTLYRLGWNRELIRLAERFVRGLPFTTSLVDN